MHELIALKGAAPATGIGDRLGVWINVFALAQLRNSSVLLEWPKAWEAMTLSLHAPVMAALSCLAMPSYVTQDNQTQSHASTLMLDLTVPTILRDFTPRGRQQKAAHFRHRVAFDKLPHLMWGLWQQRRLLAPSTSCGSYLHAYHAAASSVGLTRACELPARLVRFSWRAPRIHVHLRRADRSTAGRGANKFRKNSLKALRLIASALYAAGAEPQVR